MFVSFVSFIYLFRLFVSIILSFFALKYVSGLGVIFLFFSSEIQSLIGGPYFLRLLNMARFAAAKMVLSESYTSCVNNPNQSPNGPFIPG